MLHEFVQTGSQSQCTAARPRGLSMNRRFGVPALAGPGRLKAGHQTSFAAKSGSWSQCMRKKSERGLSMNRLVAQAASLMYRRLPVGGAWNKTQAPHLASGQQVGNLRNGRLGSLRYFPNGVPGPNASESRKDSTLSNFPLPSLAVFSIFASTRHAFGDSFRPFRWHLRYRDGINRRGASGQRSSGFRLGPKCLSADVHVSRGAEHRGHFRLRRA